MGNGKEMKIMIWKYEKIMLDGFSWSSARLFINKKIHYFTSSLTSIKKWNGMDGLIFVEVDVGWVFVESDVEGGSHAIWRKVIINCSRVSFPQTD